MTLFFPSSHRHPPQRASGRVIIVMRTKNRPVLLTRALASVLAQTYPHWHLRLVNDGGEPEPLEQVLAQYEGAFGGRLTVKHHPVSLGMEAASNAALEGAEGEYVAVHDDDDAWHPEFLSRTVAFLEDEAHARYAAAATQCEVVQEEIVGDQVIERERTLWGYWRERVDFMDMLRTNSFPPICLLIRKSTVDRIGPFNADLPVLGDWDYNLRILLIGDIGALNEPLAYYHHRLPSPQHGIYGNSVHAGKNLHLDYQVLYRNSMVRRLLEKEPGFAGLLHVLLVRMGHLEERLGQVQHDTLQRTAQMLGEQEHKLNRVLGGFGEHGEKVLRVVHGFDQMQRPLRWAWRRALPIRRAIARLRGRI